MKRFLLVALLASSVALGGCGFNTIPTLEEDVKAKWGQVENTYQRRADLIPNLVEVVKGYAVHEKDTLTAVIEARAKATQTTLPRDILSNPELMKQYQAQQDSLGAVLGRLMMVKERYPELKADKRFAELQSQLEGTENRITVERMKFVQAVQRYNTEIKTLPGILWAKLWYDAKPMEQFTAEPTAKVVPKVSFK